MRCLHVRGPITPQILLMQARLATDPETGMVLPDPKFVASNVTIPEAPEDHEWIYPYTVAPHYHSQNAGPW